MKRLTRSEKLRGSMLLAVMIVITVLSILSISVFDYSVGSYRRAGRQQLLEQTRLQAENEMEYLYYRWKTELLALTPPNTVPTNLLAASAMVTDAATSTLTPFLTDATPWTASRSLEWESTSIGTVPGTQKSGLVSYFTAKALAVKTDPLLGEVRYQLGRRFAYTETSLYQFSIFYQGDLEIGTASNMTIHGDISANGDIFLGSNASGSPVLTIADKVHYGPSTHTYNGALDPDTGTVLRMGGVGGTTAVTSLQNPPVFDPTPGDGLIPDQLIQRHAQVSALAEAENFLGGVDVEQVLANFPDAYNGDGDTTVVTDADRNEVYRAIIAPPPGVAEDPVVASHRMYNKANLVIKIVGTTVTITNPNDPVDPTHNYATDAAFSSVLPAAQVRQTMYDKRELKNVKVSVIDVLALKNAIAAVPALSSSYNGVVYIYDTNTSDGAFRLENGALTPNFNDKGFTVATNNGLYVKGDFNTYEPGGVENRAALMGDAVTILSNNWNDANSSLPLTSRKANSGPAATPASGDATFSSNNTTTIVAAILSGNTPSSPSTTSGGAPNLVRLLEDWYNSSGTPPGQNVVFRGSLGQLFTSDYFNGQYKVNGASVGPLIRDVYQIPRSRNMTFDTTLAVNPPAGSPTTTNFYRGDYFIWH